MYFNSDPNSALNERPAKRIKKEDAINTAAAPGTTSSLRPHQAPACPSACPSIVCFSEIIFVYIQ